LHWLANEKQMNDPLIAPGAAGFSFPGCFELTAFALAEADLTTEIPQLLAARELSLLAGALGCRPSTGGKYVSITLSFLCPDRATYDAIVADLRAHPAVKWLL